MFINDVYKKEEIKKIAIQDLRRLGVKYRAKKTKPTVQEVKKSTKCFKIDLSLLPTQTVTLPDGQQLVIPIVIHQLCSFILKKIDTEGIFRKEGSKSRQNEIKLALNAGCRIETEYNVIDVAAILKTFLRELPEPLIPSSFHDFFLRCMILEKNKLESTLLLTLLLPQEHLNCLSYLLRFFNTVSLHQTQNKMNTSNLAIVVGPTFIPILDKSVIAQNRISKTCDLVKLLIENASSVGIIPDYIIDQVASINLSEESIATNADKKKKRRSGSLTRMFNGLKKIVGNNKSDEILPEVPTEVTPDLLITPIINASAKKRKLDRNGLYMKKKKELIDNLPQASLLSTPFTPVDTPLNPAKKKEKHQWYSRNKPTKHLKTEDRTNSKSSISTKSLLERRWSVVSHANVFRRNKKRNSYAGTPLRDLISKSDPSITANKKGKNEIIDEPSTLSDITESDYVRLPKSEYEKIKHRVAAIERKLSIEMENVRVMETDELKENMDNDNIQNVQSAYEQTLEQSEPMSPTTDHLARRLSRELKIRRSIGDRVIRSPSARKIGTIRRRSRELVKNTSLSRNKSWHALSDIKIPRVTLKNRENHLDEPAAISPIFKSETPDVSSNTKMVLRSSLGRTNSIVSLEENQSTRQSESSGQWVNGDSFFSNASCTSSAKMLNNRPSVAKIRSQNAGMVLAKAKLFDNLDSDKDASPRPSVRPNSKITYKVGLTKSDVRMSQRIRALKLEDKSRKSGSPRRRLEMQKQKFNKAKQTMDTNEFATPTSVKIYSTPKRSPVIKKALLQRSPKRLLRTPHVTRNTPLKIIATPGHV